MAIKREIKFRAWDKRLNEMVYSNKEDVFYINTKGAMFMYAVPKSGSGLKTEYVIDYEIMQFTGLKDSKGKDIYEGDILSYLFEDGYLSIGFVYWDTTTSSFMVDEGGEPDPTWYEYLNNITVSGNIYESHELLEK